MMMAGLYSSHVTGAADRPSPLYILHRYIVSTAEERHISIKFSQGRGKGMGGVYFLSSVQFKNTIFIFCFHSFLFISIGEPDPPKKLDVTEITKNSATLAWLPPLRDGGAKIDGYIISYQAEGQPEDNWTQYSVVKDLNIVVVGLKEAIKYKFRVAARNSVGVSLPREAEGLFEIKEQLRKLNN